jgi:hypothetical protein
MTRPEYLNCVMTPSIIQRIRSEQEHYDQNPERAEREQQLAEEHRQEQMQSDREYFEQMQSVHEHCFYKKEKKDETVNDLPF